MLREKRRSGLAPKTTQGPGKKTESSIFGMPKQQDPRTATLPALVVWAVAACVQGAVEGRGLVLSINLIHLGTEDSVSDSTLGL